MLVQVALVVFVIFGMLSLVIDVGYARMSQAQMQVAADSAGREGLRKRDLGARDPALVPAVTNAFTNDCVRRASASRLASWTFDDDIDTSTGDGGAKLGPGPLAVLTA